MRRTLIRSLERARGQTLEPPHQDFLYPNSPKAVIVVTLTRFADDN
jgi:hypothetical protein